MLNLIKRSLGFGLILFIISVPYPLHTLHLKEGLIFSLLKPLLGTLALFLKLNTSTIKTAYSDGVILYLLFFFCLTIGFIIGFAFKNWRKGDLIIHKLLSFLLAFFLLKYGCDKLIGNQFPLPEGNLAFTPLGNFSKDILFWTTMSTSKIYLVFMGLIEVLPAFLLLFIRTRKLGLLISFGVFSNVFFTNIGFDITVKLISFSFLISTIYGLSYYRKEIVSFFSSKENPYCLMRKEEDLILNKRTKYFFLMVLISFFLSESILPHLSTTESNKKSSFYGSYLVENQTKSIKRIHIHSDNYFIIELENNQFKTFPFYITDNTIDLGSRKIQFTETKNGLSLYWGKSILNLSKINLSELPIYKDDFHLTIESFSDELN